MKSEISNGNPDKQVDREIKNLIGASRRRLKETWRSLYGTEVPEKTSEDHLKRAIAYRLQERAFGGFKPATQRLLERIADDASARRPLQVSTSGDASRPRVAWKDPQSNCHRERSGLPRETGIARFPMSPTRLPARAGRDLSSSDSKPRRRRRKMEHAKPPQAVPQSGDRALFFPDQSLPPQSPRSKRIPPRDSWVRFRSS